MNSDEQTKRFEDRVTDRRCVDVMLQAERGDTIGVEGYGEYDVVQYQARYCGPELTLYDDEAERNLLLTAPDQASQLMVWTPIRNDRGNRTGWEQAAEVRAFIADVGTYDYCTECFSEIRSIEHQRADAFDACHGQFEDDDQPADPREYEP